MPVLLVIIASTRPGRLGLPVAEWFIDKVQEDGTFEVKVADLKELNLPLMDEPNHPTLRQYTKPHTKAWSTAVDEADAFVFVMPEYNYSMTAPLKNAIDYLSQEWRYKPVGLVSYGGISAGLRAAQMVKQVVTTLKMMPIPEAVMIPMVRDRMKDGKFLPTEPNEHSAEEMLKELLRWANALRVLRSE